MKPVQRLKPKEMWGLEVLVLVTFVAISIKGKRERNLMSIFICSRVFLKIIIATVKVIDRKILGDKKAEIVLVNLVGAQAYGEIGGET